MQLNQNIQRVAHDDFFEMGLYGYHVIGAIKAGEYPWPSENGEMPGSYVELKADKRLGGLQEATSRGKVSETHILLVEVDNPDDPGVIDSLKCHVEAKID